jgi:WD40 repeat protein
MRFTLVTLAAAAGLLAPFPAQAANPPRDAFGDPLPTGAVLRLGTTRLRHAELSSLAFTADGKLVSFGGDHVVRTWDVATGKQIGERAIEKGKANRQIAGRQLSANAKRLAVPVGDRLKVFDVATGRELAAVTVGNPGPVTVGFSPDGSRLGMIDWEEGHVQVCDVGANTSRSLARLQDTAPLAGLAFSPDGTRLGVAVRTQGVVVWDLGVGRELARLGDRDLYPDSISFDATGDVLAVLDAVLPTSCHFYRVSTRTPLDGWSVPKVDTGTAWVCFAGAGSLLLIGDDYRLTWFDAKAGKVIRAVDGAAKVRPAFSADGKWVATGGRGTIRVWDIGSGRSALPANVADAPADEVHGVAVSPDGKSLVTRGTGDALIRLWDLDGRATGTIPVDWSGGRNPIFSPDGRHLYAPVRAMNALGRWELPGGKLTGQYALAEPAGDYHFLGHFGLSTDGRRMAAVARPYSIRAPGSPERPVTGSVTFWDTATTTREKPRPLTLDPWTTNAAFSPDLRWYCSDDRMRSLTGGNDFRLDIPRDWRSSRTAVSPDGRLVAQMVFADQKRLMNEGPWAWVTPRGIVVHETATGKRVRTLAVGQSGDIVFTPDSLSLVVTDPAAITRWDLASQKPVVRHKAPGSFVGSFGHSFASSLALFPDSNRAITGHIDTTALVWDLTPPARPVRTMTERELTAAWADLAGDDAAKAYTAIWALADARGDAVPFLRARVRPVAVPTDDAIRKLVGRLDAAGFADREAAEKELRRIGAAAAPALRGLLKGGLSAEQAKRVERVLEAAAHPVLSAGEKLRQVRAVAVLEMAKTTEARKLLAELAGGAAEDRATMEATGALRRLVR